MVEADSDLTEDADGSAVEGDSPPADLPAETGGARARWPARLKRTVSAWPDIVVAGVLALATFVVHNVGYMFSVPFWTDEAWVAISTKLPLDQLTRVTASTPVGWSLLLRLVFAGGAERLRIIPLLFAAATVIVAYGYVRSLPWPRLWLSRIAAALAGIAALLVPSALLRDDLKQYTADAFVTLLILWLVSRLESSWTRRRLIALTATVVVAFLFSAVTVFVGAAAFGSVVLIQLFRRNWPRTIESAIAGVVAGALLLLTFLVLYKPGIPPGLHEYWAEYYLPVSKGFGPSWHYLLDHGKAMATYLGMGPLLLAVLLVAGGVVTLFRLRRLSVALIVPALLAEMIVLGAIKQYPLFDLRTSHFLTTAFAVTAAIGIGGLVTVAARWHVAAGVAVAVVAVVLFATNTHVQDAFRSVTAIPEEDVRAPTQYIAAHQEPKDIIVVGALSNWGFAYYWNKGTPAISPVSTNLQQFVTVFPDQPNILVATDRSEPAVDEVISAAAAQAAKAGQGARIWVIHRHVNGQELKAYADAAKAHHLTVKSIMPGALDLLTPGP